MAALVVPLILLAACDGPAPIAAETIEAESATAEITELACVQDGQLTVELYGAIRASIDWQGDVMSCTGMPRPEGEGARVRLSGPLSTGDESRTLAFILGLPGLEVGQSGSELPTNVTLIEEGTGRFYGTPDTNGCWTEIAKQDPIGNDGGSLYRIEGTLYCVSPLGELNGSASVTFTELKFTGRLTWN